MQNGGGKICSEVVGSGAFGTDAAGPWGCSCRLRSGVSPVPKCEGPGAPSARFLGRRDRGHPPARKFLGRVRGRSAFVGINRKCTKGTGFHLFLHFSG
jgi:hypothetical protein